jgi:hypothetical protein
MFGVNDPATALIADAMHVGGGGTVETIDGRSRFCPQPAL